MQTNSMTLGGFSSQAEALFARAEKFRNTTLEPDAFNWEFVDREVSVEALREAARLGMTGIEVDRAFGGLGLGFREKVRVIEILSRSSMSFAFSLINSQNVASRIAAQGSESHRNQLLPDLLSGQRFGATALTEPHAGSDFAAISTTARRTSSGWVLNGEKAWITNGAVADVILCYAQTDPERQQDGIACFVIDGTKPGFERELPYALVAGSTVGVSGFSLVDYEVVDDDLIIEPGRGFRQALHGINGARIYAAAMSCAAVRSALAEAVEYATAREAFGQSLLEHQGLAWSLADVANRLEAAEALTANALDLYEELNAQVPGDVGAVDVRRTALSAAHAKRFAVLLLGPALSSCMQAMGAEGLRASRLVGRHLSEARICGYVDGTTEMMTERVRASLEDFYGFDSAAAVSVAALRAFSPPSTDTPPAVEGDELQDDETVDLTDEIDLTDGAQQEAIQTTDLEPDMAVLAAAAAAATVAAVADAGAGADTGPVTPGAGADTGPVTSGEVTDSTAEVLGSLPSDESLVAPAAAAFDNLDDPEPPPPSEPSGPSPEPPLPPPPPPPEDAVPFDLPLPPPPPAGVPVEPADPTVVESRFFSPDPPESPADPGGAEPTPADVVFEPPLPPVSSALPSEPPLPPSEGPGVVFEPPLPPVSSALPSEPPLPPSEGPGVVFEPPLPPEPFPLEPGEVLTEETALPPLPGDEHRLTPTFSNDENVIGEVGADDEVASTPPLPPDSLRRDGS